MILVHILIGLVAAYCLGSLLEWYVHKHHMHEPGWMNLYVGHVASHHAAYRRDFTHANPTCKRHDDLTFDHRPLVWAPVFLLPFMVPLPIESFILLATVAIHSVCWWAFHLEMHEPKQRWFSRTPWYRWCLANHKIHHEHPGRRFNALLPGADWVMGTA